MCSIGTARSGQIRRDLLFTGRGIEAEDGAVEELQGCDGLVVRDFVAGIAGVDVSSIQLNKPPICFAGWGDLLDSCE